MKDGRDPTLDYGKGILVLLIYCYHCLNYSTFSSLGFQLLGWLPVSFICISGFLVSHVYGARFATRPWDCSKRLWVRGLKLLVLFTILNLLILLVRQRNGQEFLAGLSNFGSHWWNIYVDGEGRFASFRILVPIAYLLLIAPVLLIAERLDRRIIPVGLVLVVVLFTFLDLQGRLSAHLILMSASLPGILYGRSKLEDLATVNWHPGLSLLAYLALFATGVLLGSNYLVQLLWAITGLALVGALSARLSISADPHWCPLACLNHLGQQSLFAYILQIGILQLLLKFTGPMHPFSSGFLWVFLLGLVLMVLTVELLHWAKEFSPRFKLVYYLVFP